MIEFIKDSGDKLAQASNGNPVISVIVVGFFYVWFNMLLALVEKLAFGERFEHWLDPVFGFFFICYAGYSVVACAYHNTDGRQ